MVKPRLKHSQQSPDKLWIWGTHAVLAALRNPQRKCYRLLATRNAFKELSVPENTLPCKLELIEGGDFLRFLAEGVVNQGLALETAPLNEKPLSQLKGVEQGVLIVLDQVTDPHNVGAILRTAKAFGALGVVLTERNAPPLGGVLAKTASGALDLLPIWTVNNLSRYLEQLKDHGFWTVGLDERAPQTIGTTDLPEKIALIMGAEGEGLRRLTQEKCDFLVKLPTDPDFPTLNVSVATAVALYEVSSNR